MSAVLRFYQPLYFMCEAAEENALFQNSMGIQNSNTVLSLFCKNYIGNFILAYF